MKTSLKIGHISDSHICQFLPIDPQHPPYITQNTFHRFTDALTQCKTMGVDHLVITGDLIDLSQPILDLLDKRGVAFEHMIGVQSEYNAVRQALDACGLSFSILPGNHDHYGCFYRTFPKGDFSTVDNKGYRFISFYDQVCDDGYARREGGERRRMLDVCNDKHASLQIHLQHFVCYPTIHKPYPFNYYDAEDITKTVVQSGNVVLCLSGHYHPGIALQKKMNTYFATAPAFGKSPFPFVIYTLKGREVSSEWVTRT